MADDHTQNGDQDLATTVAELQSELAQLKESLAAAEKTVADLEKFKDLAARAQADLQNAKARVEREREEIGKYALEGVIKRLLPTIDNLQRAMTHLPEDLQKNEWVKGVLSIEQELMRTLSDIGLARIESLNQPIDPHKHEPLMTGPGDEGKVIEVFEEGYELHGRVLRPAKVKVGDGTKGEL